MFCLYSFVLRRRNKLGNFFASVLAAMGRSQSTPGLVESRGKVPLEEMWVPPGLIGLTPAYPRSLLGSPPRHVPDSPGSTSSGRSHHHTPASQARSGNYFQKHVNISLFVLLNKIRRN